MVQAEKNQSFSRREDSLLIKLLLSVNGLIRRKSGFRELSENSDYRMEGMLMTFLLCKTNQNLLLFLFPGKFLNHPSPTI